MRLLIGWIIEQKRMAKCPVCRQPAELRINLKLFCSFECATKWGKAQSEKVKAKKQTEQRRADREKLKRLKTRSEWLKDLQVVFNKFIRLRDAGKPCISCGRDTGAKMNAGHYLSVGAHPELRFNEMNCHRQCEHCNSFKSGNQAQYRPRLIEKIGLDNVEWLEGKHEPLKLTIDEIKIMLADYRVRVKELMRANE